MDILEIYTTQLAGLQPEQVSASNVVQHWFWAEGEEMQKEDLKSQLIENLGINMNLELFIALKLS